MHAVEVRAEKVRGALDRGPTARQDGDRRTTSSWPTRPTRWGSEALARDLEALPGWLAPGALVVLERSARSPEPRWPAGLSTPALAPLRRDDALVRSRRRPRPGDAETAEDDLTGAAR